jgi:hypothetical protein
MPAFGNPNVPAGEPADERSARELAKLVHKLRWIGANDEAEKVLRKLRFSRTEECVLTAPRETD